MVNNEYALMDTCYSLWAVLYNKHINTSWWDCGGMKFKRSGIEPNCDHPKPQLTTPGNYFNHPYFIFAIVIAALTKYWLLGKSILQIYEAR